MSSLLITVTPNALRGYDATVTRKASRVELDSEGFDRVTLHTANAPSETRAREFAQAWIDANPTLCRAPRMRRAVSEGEFESRAESREAARNERDYQ